MLFHLKYNNCKFLGSTRKLFQSHLEKRNIWFHYSFYVTLSTCMFFIFILLTMKEKFRTVRERPNGYFMRYFKVINDIFLTSIGFFNSPDFYESFKIIKIVIIILIKIFFCNNYFIVQITIKKECMIF